MELIEVQDLLPLEDLLCESGKRDQSSESFCLLEMYVLDSIVAQLGYNVFHVLAMLLVNYHMEVLYAQRKVVARLLS